jgi:hypothetical protein
MKTSFKGRRRKETETEGLNMIGTDRGSLCHGPMP